MNLAQIVGPVVAAVNPRVTVTLQHSLGYTTGPQGRRVPKYDFPVKVLAQAQDLSNKDLRQLEGLNITGSSQKMYLFGKINGTVRVTKTGGDLITMEDGSVYLTTAVLEQWFDWCAVSVTLQNGS